MKKIGKLHFNTLTARKWGKPRFWKLFYFITDWAEIFIIDSFFPDENSPFLTFSRVVNRLEVIWGQKLKKINYGVKQLVHMIWNFNWTILAPIYLYYIERFLISRLEKSYKHSNFFWKKSYPSGEKNYFKKNASNNFFSFFDII